MPLYEYEHLPPLAATGCPRPRVFEEMQSLHDAPLALCSDCGGNLQRLISRVTCTAPRSDRHLRDQGFTKLVRRDDGVYENVTARDGESRVVHTDNLSELASLKPQLGD